MKKTLLLATLLPLPLHAALIECWPFNDVPAGAINGNGSVVSLGINGMPAVILGGGASSFCNMIDLPGGGSATAAFYSFGYCGGLFPSRFVTLGNLPLGTLSATASTLTWCHQSSPKSNQ